MMKTIVCISLGYFLLPALIITAGNPIESVNKVIVSSGIFLEIERAQQYTLDIKSPDLDIECLIHTIEDGVLTLKLVSSLNCRGTVTARLRCPSIKELEIMGNAEVSTFNLLKTDTLIVVQRSGGKSVLDLDIEYLDVRITEGAIFSANGYANKQVIHVSSNATFSGFELEGVHVDIQSSFGGKGKVCATEKLTALSRIGGYIGYKCKPEQLELEKKGNGVIEALTE